MPRVGENEGVGFIGVSAKLLVDVCSGVLTLRSYFSILVPVLESWYRHLGFVHFLGQDVRQPDHSILQFIGARCVVR